MSTRDRHPANSGAIIADQPEELSMDEIIDRYRGQWILMRVTEDDEDGWPARGYLLARAPSQAEILEAEERLPRADAAADGRVLPYYSFLAQHDISSGPEYEAAVMQLVAELTAARQARGA
jgi:hypothetical protein